MNEYEEYEYIYIHIHKNINMYVFTYGTFEELSLVQLLISLRLPIYSNHGREFER